MFSEFPRQWIPVFEWYRVAWKNSTAPKKYLPIFSDKDEREISALVDLAKSHNSLRALVEATSMLDPIVSDCLYIVDNSIPLTDDYVSRDVEYVAADKGKRLLLNGWQSYGRPSVRVLEQLAAKIKPSRTTAVVLPCSLRRPYTQSRTHKKIYTELVQRGFQLKSLHKVVITSLGVLPEELWDLPQARMYDAGVPDIYRILRLVRSYFKRAHYEFVIDCLQFEPYSDVLRIAHRENIIKRLEKIRIPGQRHFYIRH